MGLFRDGWTEADVEAVIERGNPEELLHAPIVVTMDPSDYEWALSVCLRLVGHPRTHASAPTRYSDSGTSRARAGGSTRSS